jgi:hypothetical protein
MKRAKSLQNKLQIKMPAMRQSGMHSGLGDDSGDDLSDESGDDSDDGGEQGEGEGELPDLPLIGVNNNNNSNTPSKSRPKRRLSPIANNNNISLKNDYSLEGSLSTGGNKKSKRNSEVLLEQISKGISAINEFCANQNQILQSNQQLLYSLTAATQNHAQMLTYLISLTQGNSNPQLPSTANLFPTLTPNNLPSLNNSGH